MADPTPDWKDDEAVVRAAVPDAWLEDLGNGFVIRRSRDGRIESIGHHLTPDGAWRNARQHFTVQAYEKAHSPAYERPEAEDAPGFTPGPWKLAIHQQGINAGKRSIQCVVTADDGTTVVYSISNLANAHLIVALPELYQMLNECVDRYLDHYPEQKRRVMLALAKARGEQP